MFFLFLNSILQALGHFIVSTCSIAICACLKLLFCLYMYKSDELLVFQNNSQVVQSRVKRKWRQHYQVHPLSWLLSNNWLERWHFVSVLRIFSNPLLLSNQTKTKGVPGSVAHPIPLPLGLLCTTFLNA